MSDDTNLLDVLAVTEGIDNVEKDNNLLTFYQCEYLSELYWLINIIFFDVLCFITYIFIN